MVLKMIMIGFTFLGLGVTQLNQDLIKVYQKDIRKTLNKFSIIDKKEEVDFKKLQYSDAQPFYSFVNNEEQLFYLFLNEVRSCNLNGCTGSLSNNTQELEGEYFDLAILLDQSGDIKFVKMLDYFSDYGYEIGSKRYLSEYIGKNVCSENIESVDGISGATVSYNALQQSIFDACSKLQSIDDQTVEK